MSCRSHRGLIPGGVRQISGNAVITNSSLERLAIEFLFPTEAAGERIVSCRGCKENTK